ncbi:MAG TPA: hypothetical protein VJP80_03500 [Candidatus Saccharimonadales bacterium]|nr:hypothetical protein [Candidatus Saccharimonadales bacterium]
MPKYSDAVRRAIERPGQLSNINGVFVPNRIDDLTIVLALPSNIHEMPDDTFIRTFDETVPSDLCPSHRIFTADPQELPAITGEVVAAATERWGLSEAGQAQWLDSIAHDVPHEMKHGSVSEIIGGKPIYSIGLALNPDEQVATCWAETHTIGEATKLGFAALVAYPEDPSLGDRMSLKHLGYRGVEDVAERAINAGLPVPLSYRPPTTS